MAKRHGDALDGKAKRGQHQANPCIVRRKEDQYGANKNQYRRKNTSCSRVVYHGRSLPESCRQTHAGLRFIIAPHTPTRLDLSQANGSRHSGTFSGDHLSGQPDVVSHFFMTIVVPFPTSEMMSNSSISRFALGSPIPSPCDVV